jgi:hypothetical protein
MYIRCASTTDVGRDRVARVLERGATLRKRMPRVGSAPDPKSAFENVGSLEAMLRSPR